MPTLPVERIVMRSEIVVSVGELYTPRRSESESSQPMMDVSAVSPTPAHWLRGVVADVQPACRDFVRVTAAGVCHLVPAKLVRPEGAV